MLLHQPVTSSSFFQRKGIVLVVVIALLALFAAVALSFVFYAESNATASHYAAQAQSLSGVNLDPELVLGYFLNQFIYGTNNEDSALRGHSLAENMFGPAPGGAPFSGTGRLRYPLGHPKTGTTKDNFHLINYQNYESVDGFKRRPNYYGFTSDPNHKLVAETGVPWTYPDEQNMFVAAVNAAGEVLIQSYYRPWLHDPKDSNNVGWEKYLTLRPHNSYHSSFLTPDADFGGDVRNLDWARGVPKWDPITNKKVYSLNDSFWIDLGFPVRTAPDGRKYKPLFAPLVMELDSRVNLWIAGALRDGNPMTGNQGWGRWEINPSHVLANPAEVNNLFVGFGGVPGRYGTNAVPEGSRPFIMDPPPWYSRLDFDGNGTALTLPAPGGLLPFPTFPATWESGNANELGSPIAPSTYNHPWNFKYFNPTPDDSRYPALSNSEAAFRLFGKGSTGLTSDLFKLLPYNMSNARSRGLTTLMSFDVNRPGAVPFYAHDTSSTSPYQYDPALGRPTLNPPVAYPALPPNPLPNSEFTADWRSKLAGLTRINLQRSLREYPKTISLNPGNPQNPPLDTADAGVLQDYVNATTDRQTFAKDLYQMLVQVTGAQDPNAPGGGLPKNDPRFQAARWLAQLAVNIVDSIDPDDFATPFIWYKDPLLPTDVSKWETLLGVELPKLLLNEFYAQLDNDPNDNSINANDIANSKASKYKLNCWVELHNPFQDTPSGNTQDYPLDNGDARLKVGSYTVHRIIVSNPDPNLRSVDNLTGVPDPAKQILMLDDWDGNPLPKGVGKGKGLLAQLTAVQQRVQPGNGYYAVADGSIRGFFVVGPTLAQYGGPVWAGRDPNLPTTYVNDQMSAVVPLLNPPTELTVILQRLACPYLPPDNNPASATYNPYITVDIMDQLTLNQRGYYDGRLLDDVGPAPKNPPSPTAWATWGRRQPYAGLVNQGALQNPITQTANQPKHTFFRHNAREDSAAPYPDVITKPSAATPGQTLTVPFDWLFHHDRKPINVMELLHVSGFRPHELTQEFVNAAGQPHAHRAPWRDEKSLIYRFLEMTYTRDLVFGAVEGGITPGKININMLFDYETFLALCDPQAGNGFNAATVKSIYDRFVASRTPAVLPDGTRIPVGGDRPIWPFGAGVHSALPNSQYPNGLGLNNTLLRADNAGTIFSSGGNHPYQQDELLTKIYNNVTLRSNCFAVWVTVGFFEVVDENARPPKLGAEIGRAENRHTRHRMFALIDRTNLPGNPGPQATYNPRNDTKVVPYFTVID